MVVVGDEARDKEGVKLEQLLITEDTREAGDDDLEEFVLKDVGDSIEGDDSRPDDLRVAYGEVGGEGCATKLEFEFEDNIIRFDLVFWLLFPEEVLLLSLVGVGGVLDLSLRCLVVLVSTELLGAEDKG